MKIQAVKGTRDFYPDDMRLRNWITDTWRQVSLRNGFEEYDSPIFEYLDLFTIKSGEAIASELFSFTDRAGRSLAIRPESTPSLARMVNAKINSLPRPIKWFTIQRCCRAEKPQRGRSREFFCWNIDIIGEDSPIADAECVLVAVEALSQLGLTPADVRIRYSSRQLMMQVMRNFGVPETDFPKVLGALDKRSKVPEEAFRGMLEQVIPDETARAGLLRFISMPELGADPGESIARDVGMEITRPTVEAIGRLQRFRGALESFGVLDWCEYDTSIIRGLAYYTGIVYEVFDRGGSLRAVAGGGRYDNLLEVLGGPRIGATGFGMGDVVLGLLLAEKGKSPEARQLLDDFVIDGGEDLMSIVLQVVAALRSKGRSADFSYKRSSLGKQLKEANRRRARRAVIIRDRTTVAVKDLTTGQQREKPLAEFLATPSDV